MASVPPMISLVQTTHFDEWRATILDLIVAQSRA